MTKAIYLSLNFSSVLQLWPSGKYQDGFQDCNLNLTWAMFTLTSRVGQRRSIEQNIWCRWVDVHTTCFPQEESSPWAPRLLTLTKAHSKWGRLGGLLQECAHDPSWNVNVNSPTKCHMDVKSHHMLILSSSSITSCLCKSQAGKDPTMTIPFLTGS